MCSFSFGVLISTFAYLKIFKKRIVKGAICKNYSGDFVLETLLCSATSGEKHIMQEAVHYGSSRLSVQNYHQAA